MPLFLSSIATQRKEEDLTSTKIQTEMTEMGLTGDDAQDRPKLRRMIGNDVPRVTGNGEAIEDSCMIFVLLSCDCHAYLTVVATNG